VSEYDPPLKTDSMPEDLAVREEEAWLDNDFICPACCCGLAIEPEEDTGEQGGAGGEPNQG